MDIKNIEGAQKILYKSGSTIVEQGEKTDHVYYLSSGICYRKKLFENGNESIDGLRHATGKIDSVIGLLTAIDGYDHYLSGFTALTDCECYRIRTRSFLDYMNDHVELLYDTIRFASREYRQLNEKYSAHSSNAISVFLCSILYELSEVRANNKRMLPPKYSNEFLSKMSGVTPVTTARIMSYLKDRGIVRRTSKGLIIEDVDALQEYIDGKEMKYRK